MYIWRKAYHTKRSGNLSLDKKGIVNAFKQKQSRSIVVCLFFLILKNVLPSPSSGLVCLTLQY